MEPLLDLKFSECDFCAELGGGHPRLLGLPHSLVERRVFRTSERSVVALADASPILPGHVLLVPERHVSRFSLADCSALASAFHHLASRFRAGRHAVFFEHGGFSCIRHGLCTEHAHLHVLEAPEIPMSELLRSVTQRGGCYSRRFDSIEAVYRERLSASAADYLVLGVASPNGIDAREIHFDTVESQVLRLVLAECLGVSPHIRDPDARAAAVRSTCDMLGGLSYHAATRVGLPAAIRQERKRECYGCEHECPRRVGDRAVGILR